MHNENRFLDTFRGHNTRPNRFFSNLPLIMEHRHTETLLPEICKKKGTALSYLI